MLVFFCLVSFLCLFCFFGGAVVSVSVLLLLGSWCSFCVLFVDFVAVLGVFVFCLVLWIRLCFVYFLVYFLFLWFAG